MAGRPRTMVKLVGDIELSAFGVANAISRLIPERYRENPSGADPVAEAWNELLGSAVSTWGAANDLNMTLRDKAGLPLECPTDQCHLERRGSVVGSGVCDETSELGDEEPESAV